MSESEFRPEFDLGNFRYAVAKYVRLLIRARWRDDPGFLDEQALKDWDLLNINNDHIPDNSIPPWRLLEEAAEALGILNDRFIPRCPSGGIRVMSGDTPEIRLMYAIAFLAECWGGGPYLNEALLEGAKSIREDCAIDWTKLVDWSKLPAIRADLNKLPHPRPDDAANHAGQNVFRWRANSKMWEIAYKGGQAIFLPERVGLFYLHELVDKPGKIITASDLRRAYASWSTDPTSPLRNHTEQAVLDGHGARDDGGSNEVLGSPGQDLGEELDDEARANLRARIAELPAKIESLRSQGKMAQADELERDLADLKRVNKASLSLGGRPKMIADVLKQAQDAVSKAIARALEELKTAYPPLHDHLRLNLEYGSKCCYRPEPAVVWNK